MVKQVELLSPARELAGWPIGFFPYVKFLAQNQISIMTIKTSLQYII